MFKTIDDIYNHIGQSMFEHLHVKWDKVYLGVNLHQLNTMKILLGISRSIFIVKNMKILI